MKKVLISSLSILLAGILLGGCGNSQGKKQSTENRNSSLKAENSSLKSKQASTKHVKYSNQNYALMAYLKLQDQSAEDLKQNTDNMHWKQDENNRFTIDFGAHTTVMTVTNKQVQITYDKVTKDGMGQGNGHKIYSKQMLANEFGSQKNVLDEILDTVENASKESDRSNSMSSIQSTQSSTTNNQAETQKNNNSNTVPNQANASNSNASNSQEKPLVKDGNTYRPKYNENGQVDSWQVTGSDGITRTMGDPSPNWQEIENEYNTLNNK